MKGPVVFGTVQVLQHSRRHFQGKRRVIGACLQQQNPIACITGQVVGQNTTGRSRAYNDVIKNHFGISLQSIAQTKCFPIRESLQQALRWLLYIQVNLLFYNKLTKG